MQHVTHVSHLDEDAGEQEAEAGADVVEHLADAGGGDPLVRGEPGGGHGGRGGRHHDARDPVEDGAEVVQQRQSGVRHPRPHQEDAAHRRA